MFTAIAIVLAVVALFFARSANRRVDELRLELERVVQASGLPFVPQQPPSPPPTGGPEAHTTPQPQAEIPVYAPPASPPRPWSIDWENIIGIRLFSWIGGIAFVLAAVFLFKEAVEHGWLR